MIPGIPGNLSLSSTDQAASAANAAQRGGGADGGQRSSIFNNIATSGSRLAATASADAGGIPIWVWIMMAAAGLAVAWFIFKGRRP